MNKKLVKLVWTVLTIVALAGMLPAAALAAPVQQDAACAEEYTVQAGDWLSRLAEKFYGDVTAYPAIVQATNMQVGTNGFQQIDNPDLIEVGMLLCIPAQADGQPMVGETGQMTEETGQMTETGQMEQSMPSEESSLVAPADEMLMVVRNLSIANEPSTLTISGGEYGGGEQITVDAGQEIMLELEPADYRVVWSTPAIEENIARDFTAVAGTTTIANFVPEDGVANFRFNVNLNQEQAQQQPQQQTEEDAAAMEDTTFPYEPPQGKGLFVIGNRSIANIPSTLTLTGGRFGGGTQFTVNPGDELLLPVDSGEFVMQWSVPIDEEREPGETVVVSRNTQISAGESLLYWIVPEEFRAFRQPAGEAPQELAPTP